ncbi:MAG TPA: ATP-binding cassette domain-containing protein, partial [Nitrospinaceae bacterium]|nr:ATP-binding cassette domain-containing protein [Nitrospinaceae bacterium]
GQSGAGKTTLFKVLFGWEKFDRGQILVGGINVSKLNEKNLYLLRRKIGIVFQDYKLLARKTVFENVAFAQQIIGADAKTARSKTWNALKRVGLAKKKDSYPSQLSGGEQQRVSIARAVVNDPELILADEPTGNLDSEISKEILAVFQKINQQGKTIIIATHSAEILQAKEFRRLSLDRGKLLQF